MMSVLVPAIRSVRRRLPSIRRIFARPLTLTGVGVAVVWFLIAIAAPVLAPYNPLTTSASLLQAPSMDHLLGTDQLGRDVLSRILWGARLTIPAALFLVAMALVVGGALGAVAGFFRGVTDGIIMRVADTLFGFPAIILAMAVTAALGPGLKNAAIALAVVLAPTYARLVRGLVLSIGESEYVQSAWLLGVTPYRTLASDVLPMVAGPVVVYATLDVANAVLLLSALSFLGLGNQPPSPDWGSMLAESTQYFQAWWLVLFPGLAILSIVLAFNFLGDDARDAFDPRESAH